MKVFISWSGDQSKAIAVAFRDFIGDVIQNVKPFLSADIAAGTRWPERLADELEETGVGVLCLTPDNLGSPWILFEAGALAKDKAVSIVCPFLYGLKASDLSWPLAQFQANAATVDGVTSIVVSINAAMGDEGLSHDKLTRSIKRCIGRFKKAMKDVPPPAKKKPIDPAAALEEILAAVRNRPGSYRFAPMGSSQTNQWWPRAFYAEQQPLPDFKITFRGGPLDGKKIAPSDPDPLSEVAKGIFKATFGAPPLTRFVISVRQNGVTVYRCTLKKGDKEHYLIQVGLIRQMDEPWYDVKYEIVSNISNITPKGETQLIQAAFITEDVAGEILPQPLKETETKGKAKNK